MYRTVEDYLDALKQALEGTDSATLQDALTDAEEHLRTALEANADDGLDTIIEAYGSPEETAAAYAEVERRTAPTLAGSAAKKERSGLGRFFAIYADARAWGALFYMLIAFVTGIIYFTWAVTGVSLSISLSVFIFGLPLALLFILSVRGIAWLEGRLVEALLGVRMPRRPLFSPQNIKWQERLKSLITDKHTWFSLLYMFLQFVLGTLYFVVLVTAFATAMVGFAIPVVQEIFNEPTVTTLAGQYFLPVWSYPLIILASILLWTATMHLVRAVGGLHGKYAKAMLVAEQD